MENLSFNFSKIIGKIKNMNAVNNGPVKNIRGKDNLLLYKELNLPFARLHDSSFYSNYGGEFAVDVHRIFRDFNANPYDEKNYIFQPTDVYLANITETGTKIFYRLGASIEHGYKFGTYPPTDFKKWAIVCEHIIMHYTKGWGNGFCYDIKYWEIWNEPDCNGFGENNPCWRGTDKQFIDFFEIVFKHLKNCFPNLKIGGPAFVGGWENEYREEFIHQMQLRKVNLDFYSYHLYSNQINSFKLTAEYIRNLLNKYGFNNTEIILNEWNYIEGWKNEAWFSSITKEKNYIGASYVVATMCSCQNLPIDMLMYYDARPCSMNGIFNTDFLTPLKTYYSFLAFKNIKTLGNEIECLNDCENVFCVAAKNDTEKNILLTYYNYEKLNKKTIQINLTGLENNTSAEIFLLNENNNLESVKKVNIAENSSINLCLEIYDVVLIKIK